MDIRLCCVLLGLVAMATGSDAEEEKSNRPTKQATAYRDHSGYRGDGFESHESRRPHGPYYMGYDPYRQLDQYKEKYDGGMYYYGGRYTGNYSYKYCILLNNFIFLVQAVMFAKIHVSILLWTGIYPMYRRLVLA